MSKNNKEKTVNELVPNLGDISYLMDELRTLINFVWGPIETQLKDINEKGEELSDRSRDFKEIVVATILIKDWLKNQDQMVNQAKMIQKLGVNGNNVTILDKGNPKSMSSVMGGIKELVDERIKEDTK